MDDEIEWFDTGSTTASDDWGVYDDSDGSEYDFSTIIGGARSFLPVSSGNGGAVFRPTMGAVPAAGGVAGAALGAVMTLGGRLAGMFGRGAGTAVINGVKFSMARLWPYIRQYGPGAVAAALGITVAELGALAMQAPQSSRKRRRGISSRDISTTSRVLRFNARLNRRFGQRGGSRRSYRPRRRYAYC